MKLQHHLGGLEGLGPVAFEKRVFVEEWEKRIFGIHAAMMGAVDLAPRGRSGLRHRRRAHQLPQRVDLGGPAQGRRGDEPLRLLPATATTRSGWAGSPGSSSRTATSPREELDAATSRYRADPDAALPEQRRTRDRRPGGALPPRGRQPTPRTGGAAVRGRRHGARRGSAARRHTPGCPAICAVTAEPSRGSSRATTPTSAPPAPTVSATPSRSTSCVSSPTRSGATRRRRARARSTPSCTRPTYREDPR